MPDQPNPCRTTRHCVHHDFCHRCTPSLTVASRYLVKAISAARIDDERKGTVYAQLAATVRDAARTASGQQPEHAPAYYGVNGCTCRAWTTVGGVPRYLRGDESVELIGGWDEQPDCPHHAPAVGQPAEAQATDEAPADTTAAIEMWARLLNAADVHVADGDHPTWQQLSTTPGRGQDEYRKAARWLMGRAIVPPEVIRAKILREAADAAERLMDERYGPDCAYAIGGRDVATELRRMAEEARS